MPQTPELTPEFWNRVSSEYSSAVHEPENPAWKSFVTDTFVQYHRLVRAGWKFFLVDEIPYESSSAMFEDCKLRVLKVYTGGKLVWDNPIAQLTTAKFAYRGQFVPATVNELFRTVHDVYGHWGNGSLPVPFETLDGEVSAYLRHKREYSPESMPALYSETIGQLAFHQVTGGFVDRQENKIIPVRL